MNRVRVGDTVRFRCNQHDVGPDGRRRWLTGDTAVVTRVERDNTGVWFGVDGGSPDISRPAVELVP